MNFLMDGESIREAITVLQAKEKGIIMPMQNYNNIMGA
jgi:hypothetical protein